MALIKLCPNCNTERPVNEIYCQGLISEATCNWSLSDVFASQAKSQSEKSNTSVLETPLAISSTLECLNGHAMMAGDQFCMQCGADLADDSALAQSTNVPDEPVSQGFIGTLIGHWIIRSQVNTSNQSKECFSVESQTDGQRGFLTLYLEHFEPDLSIYEVLSSMDQDHTPDLLDYGRWNKRAYEVYEWINGGTVLEAGYFAYDDLSQVKNFASEVGKALRDFSERGLRHRNICPRTILIRKQTPLDLVITDFGSARLSDFDLDTVAPLELTRYSAPEAIVGGVSPASDWWGLGMLLLEHVTNGECFKNVNDKALMIHIVTRGIDIPQDLQVDVRNLLCGLLARDPLERWQWDSVNKWLAGEYVETPVDKNTSKDIEGEREISLGNVVYRSPQRFALAAAEEANWQEAKQIFLSGELATWAKELFPDNTISAFVNRLQSLGKIDSDWRFSLSLMLFNKFLPLTNKGQIISPAWLLENPQEAYELLISDVPLLLEELEREQWLVLLHYRRENVLERAKLLNIELDSSRLKVNLLATSIANLSAERNLLREIFPAATINSLSSLLEKNRLSEEDLIILLSAKYSQFVSLDQIVEDTHKLFARYSAHSFDLNKVKLLFSKPRFEIYKLIDERCAGFARCENTSVNNWVDSYRLERRVSLPRAAVILSIQKEEWQQPDKHEYSSNLLKFFEKRVSNSVLRGALVRLIISKTTSKIDLTELGTPFRSAASILESIVSREEFPQKVDPKVYQSNTILDRRIFRMLTQSNNFRRDTGIDSLYLGFPFIVIGGEAARKARPKIAPILLWPVAMEYKLGSQGSLTLCFDRNREEVRLNPALEGLLGRERLEQWKRARNEILSKSTINASEIMNILGSIVPANSLEIVKHPAVSHTLDEGVMELESSAVIFNAHFVGQAISEDIRRLQTVPVHNTSLESLLKISEVKVNNFNSEQHSEAQKYSIVPIDPSQEKSVLQARHQPGLVIEGPPGTGKSQTIVNLIADSIGRNEKVLVVCQKQAALHVVEKRLEAAGLGSRLICVNDVNRDRQNLIRSVREQLPGILKDDFDLKSLIQRREVTANKIDRLEQELNKRHTTIHEIDSICNMSYRQLISQLISLEKLTEHELINVPELRAQFANLSPDAINILEENCSTLAIDWLYSDFEDSKLKCFKIFSIDNDILNNLKDNFEELLKLETLHSLFIEKNNTKFDQEDYQAHITWKHNYEDLFLHQSQNQIENSAKWQHLFYDEVNLKSEGIDIVEELETQQSRLKELDPNSHDNAFFESLLILDDSCCKVNFSPKSFFTKINPIRFLKVRKIKSFFKNIDETYTLQRINDLSSAIELEKELRSIRNKLQPLLKKLKIVSKEKSEQDFKSINRKIYSLIEALKFVDRCAQAAEKFAFPNAAVNLLKSGKQDNYTLFIDQLNSAIKFGELRTQSTKCLEKIQVWLSETWFTEIEGKIKNSNPTMNEISLILSQLDKLHYYQNFRLHSKDFPESLLSVFKKLRTANEQLILIDRAELASCLKNIIWREAFLAWKLRIEQAQPEVLLNKKNANVKIKQLNQANEEIVKINKTLLSNTIDKDKLGSLKQWNEITRLRGPKYKKLREFYNQGKDLGLMEIRPICLMSPDVVSQTLPLESGLFDVVIFDEASQLLVDFSVPALFRAKRAVISGDEKQMPPTSFFSNRIASDEDELDAELHDDASEEEVMDYTQAWNRKEIKDCPDLLTLGKGILPTETLLVHYRSKYRSLIEYSNNAFYSGRLNIPALHPDAEIKRVKPVEVRKIMGTYLEQSNQAEAQEIVKILSSYWSQYAQTGYIPSIGVVTFNRKQAELITDTLQAHAEKDPDFNAVYYAEQKRIQNSEDMSLSNRGHVYADKRNLRYAGNR